MECETVQDTQNGKSTHTKKLNLTKKKKNHKTK